MVEVRAQGKPYVSIPRVLGRQGYFLSWNVCSTNPLIAVKFQTVNNSDTKMTGIWPLPVVCNLTRFTTVVTPPPRTPNRKLMSFLVSDSSCLVIGENCSNSSTLDANRTIQKHHPDFSTPLTYHRLHKF